MQNFVLSTKITNMVLSSKPIASILGKPQAGLICSSIVCMLASYGPCLPGIRGTVSYASKYHWSFGMLEKGVLFNRVLALLGVHFI